ncbi:hypothetical protein FB451DRAFT_1174869 [Mycena latifolia]|nr:hypothetical protein FB451DRAFT_1174869 [Mycena latifolia]
MARKNYIYLREINLWYIAWVNFVPVKRDASIKSYHPPSPPTRSRPSTIDNFNEIYATLSTVPGLCDSIGMEKAMAFVRLAGRLKDTITTAQPPSHDAAEAPQELPDGIRTFLGSAVDLPTEYIDGCWKAFGDLIWTYDEDGGGCQPRKTQRRHCSRW